MGKEKYSFEKIDAERNRLKLIENFEEQHKKGIYIICQEFFINFRNDKSLTREEKAEIVTDYVTKISSGDLKDKPWHLAVSSALALSTLVPGEITSQVIGKLADDLIQMRKVERDFVLSVIAPILKNHLEPLVDKEEGKILSSIKTHYAHAAIYGGRTHEHEVTPTQQFKTKYGEFKGDALKTLILAEFKAAIDEVNSSEDLKTLKEKLMKDPKYDILATRQGANWLNYVPGLQTSSVKAFDSIIKDAETRVEPRKNLSH